MSRHFDELRSHVPLLEKAQVLDLGSGKGKFLIDLAKQGVESVGVEYNSRYIEEAYANARASNVSISVLQGRGEELPFDDNSFDFINLSEVIEHVQDPYRVLAEVFRVLRRGGHVYLSVPNRYGLRDPHFHLYFVNWLPRKWASAFISFFGKHKNYHTEAGLQRLEEMHYYSYSHIKRVLAATGFKMRDVRTEKLRRMGWGWFTPLYWLTRLLYFDTFHLLLVKERS